MAKQRPHSLLAYALVGLLSPLPLFLIYAVIVVIAVLGRWPEWLGPAVGLLSWLGIAWGGSGVSGWVCGRVLAHRSGIAPLLLANSAGWVVLMFIGVGFASGLFAGGDDTTVPFLLIAFVVVSAVGLMITRATMRSSMRAGLTGLDAVREGRAQEGSTSTISGSSAQRSPHNI
jgi:hypothetical protein